MDINPVLKESVSTHTKKLSFILFYTYFLILICILIVSHLIRYQLNEREFEQSLLHGGGMLGVTPTSMPTTSMTPDTSILPGYNQYTSKSNNFSFQYPNSFLVQTNAPHRTDYSLNVILTLKNQDDVSIVVSIDNNVFSTDYLKKYAPTGAEEFAPEPKTIGKNTFYYYGPGGGGVCYPDQYFINLNGKILNFSFSECGTDKTPSQEIKTLSEKILSTLTF